MRRILLLTALAAACSSTGCYWHPFRQQYYCAPPVYSQPPYAAPPVAAPTYAPSTCLPQQMPQCTCY